MCPHFNSEGWDKFGGPFDFYFTLLFSVQVFPRGNESRWKARTKPSSSLGPQIDPGIEKALRKCLLNKYMNERMSANRTFPFFSVTKALLVRYIHWLSL